MSLVAYESSDGSDSDSDNDSSEPKSPGKPSLPGPISIHKPESNDISTTRETSGLLENTSVKKGLFSQLPAPKRTTDSLPEDPISRNIPVPKKETVKIRIPSLKEFEEDDEEEKLRIKRKPSKVGSGLMSLLPEPQHMALKAVAKQLIPPSVTRKAAGVRPTGAAKPKPPLPKGSDSTIDPMVSKSVSPAATLQDDNGSDEETLTDFFSLSGTKDSELEQPDTLSSGLIEEPVNQEKKNAASVYMKPLKEDRESNGAYFPSAVYSSVSCNSNASLEHVNSYNSQNVYESTNSQLHDWSNPPANSEVPAIKNEDFVRLAGKKRNAKESIEIVDVNGDDLVAGRDEWLLKSLSETNDYQPAPKRSDQPSAMHRRKHQITYLAFQAKAREQELKNQWSMNRMTKKQTQSKYGF